MSDFPDTRVSLILRLADPGDVLAWQEFSDIYAPALLALARRRGMQPADAEDITQEVLFGVARAVQRFQPDRERAKFRTWLSRIARNLIADFCSGRGRRPVAQVITDSWLEKACLSDPMNRRDEESAYDAELDEELRAATFRLAAKRIRQRVAESTWQAFEETAIQHSPPAEVAQRIGLTLGSVYVARSRVLRLLREEVQSLQSEVEVHASPNSEELQ